MQKRNIFYYIIFATAISFVFPLAVFASTTVGDLSGYAWGNNIGWVNFGCDDCDAQITDSVLSGYAWSDNYGWIRLDPDQGGVVNNSEGSLSGRAWGEQIGWINFSGVSVSSSGIFSGTATVDEGGSINFGCTNCNVSTDWRPLTTRNGGSSGSGSSGGGGGVVYGPPSGTQSIVINSANEYTNQEIVTLSLDGGNESVLMEISNSASFSGAVRESYVTSKSWTLANGDGLKTIYVRFYTTHGIASPVVFDTIFLDKTPPSLIITSIADSYLVTEDIVVSGTSEPSAEVTLFLDNEYGSFLVSSTGQWTITLGKRSVGNHHIEFYAKDLAGNISEYQKANFLVKDPIVSLNPIDLPFFPNILAPPLEPILRNLQEGIQSLLPAFLKPIEKEAPQVVVTVPQETPFAMKGQLRYLSTQTLAKLVLTPLPQDIKSLAQKLPQIQKTFDKVGIQKFTDLDKLKNVSLKLPSLTETVLPDSTALAGSFNTLRGIPVASLSLHDKVLIPPAIMFAKAGGGLVDYNVALSIDNQGNTQQTIQAIAGQSLQLIVKADAIVDTVSGYIVFKSRKSNAVTSLISWDSLTSSLLFATPNTKREVGQDSAIDQRFIISNFDYIDNGNGLYVAAITMPVVDGEYEIITVMHYEGEDSVAQEIKLTTLIDPEGYIYEKNGDKETRVLGSIVALYWLNPTNNQYELWPAKEFQQENPQTTDVRGAYSFLVPNGFYYLKVDAPGYISYDGKPFEVKEGGGVHINIELKTNAWWLKAIDWKVMILVLIIIMLLYNFYRDKMRDKNIVIVQRKK